MPNKIIWEADDARKLNSQMLAFFNYLSEADDEPSHPILDNRGNYNKVANSKNNSPLTRFDYDSLHKNSIVNSELFWQACADFVEIVWQRQATTVKSGHGMLNTRWFEGAQLNYCENLLAPNDDDAIAIYSYAEGRQGLQQLTHQQLRLRVMRCAAALQAAGVCKGTVVAGILANVPEAVIAALATTMLGGIWSSCSPDFGAAGIYERLQQLNPKIIFFTPSYVYGGKKHDCLAKMAGLLKKFPQTLAITTPHLDDTCHGYQCFENFLAKHTPPLATNYAAMDFADPLFIMFSSGTTGIPKCIVHTVGGTLLQHKKELRIHGDLGAGDCLLFYTTCGWMMWNWMLSALSVRCAIGLYDGAPHYPATANLWRVAEAMHATAVGVNPRYISICKDLRQQSSALTQLRTIFATGAPLHREHYRIVYEQIKADVHLASISGGTDILSCFMLGNVMLPVRAEEIQVKGLGMDVHAYNDQGESVVDEKGELVCASPFVSMPKGLLNDPTGTKYRQTYFNHYPQRQVWRHGDYVKITPEGGVQVYGRSDTVLNPHGVRIGSAEIYRQLEDIADLEDAVIIDHHSQLLLFVVLKGKQKLLPQHQHAIRTKIATALTKRHVPKHIYQVQALPYTLNGKKMELAVKHAFAGEKVRNQDAIANPEALDELRTVRKKFQKNT
ncbi:MAG: acetoacetate--CoA ligase [Pseudomonadota bacterium]|nr:acetoacetate--CoA ligase [Pseudomonadota bacterium]